MLTQKPTFFFRIIIPHHNVVINKQSQTKIKHINNYHKYQIICILKNKIETTVFTKKIMLIISFFFFFLVKQYYFIVTIFIAFYILFILVLQWEKEQWT